MTSRPVWLTREEIDRLLECKASFQTWDVFNALVIRPWDAAPADAAEAVLSAVQGTDIIVTASGPQHVALTRDEVMRRVLRALGWPDPEPHA